MDLELALDPRAASGRQNKRLRREGVVPGVVFGKGTESVPVQVDGRTFENLYRAAGRTSIVKLSVPGLRGSKSAMIKGVQRNPISGQALHVDFFLVDLKHEMQSDVPLVVVGEAPAVELTGGMLLTSLDHLKIRALPGDIPHEIQVDVSSLTDLDAAIHVGDLPHDEKVTVLNDPDELVVRVVPPRVEEEEVVPAEEAAQAEAEAAQAVPETEEQPADTPQEE